MTKHRASWGNLFRSLGQAFQDLMRSELDALGADLADSARRLAVVAGLFLLALFGLFWALGLLAYIFVEVLALWLPRWAAGLGGFSVVLVITLVLAAVAHRRLRKLEKPTITVRRHVTQHVEWWETRVLGESLDETNLEEEL